METIHSILVKNVWYKVWDKILFEGNTFYLCQAKEGEAIVTLIRPEDIEVING